MLAGERGRAERLNGHLDLCGVNTRRTSKSTLPWPLGEFWLIDRTNYHETAHPNPTPPNYPSVLCHPRKEVGRDPVATDPLEHHQLRLSELYSPIRWRTEIRRIINYTKKKKKEKPTIARLFKARIDTYIYMCVYLYTRGDGVASKSQDY